MAAHCAAEQGRFWEMTYYLLTQAQAMGNEDLEKYAGIIGIDVPTLSACLSAGRYDADIKASIDQANRLSIDGTPAFVIGRRRKRTSSREGCSTAPRSMPPSNRPSLPSPGPPSRRLRNPGADRRPPETVWHRLMTQTGSPVSMRPGDRTRA